MLFWPQKSSGAGMAPSGNVNGKCVLSHDAPVCSTSHQLAIISRAINNKRMSWKKAETLALIWGQEISCKSARKTNLSLKILKRQ